MKTKWRRTRFIKENMCGKVLDVGCESGSLHRLISNDNTYGLDIVVSKGIPRFCCGDAQHMPLKNGSFDTLVAGELIEELPNPEEFLRESYRVLRKGGKLIITTPNRKSWLNRLFKLYCSSAERAKNPVGRLMEWRRFREFLGYAPLPDTGFPHTRVFDRESLIKICENSGFKLSKFICFPYTVFDPTTNKITRVARLFSLLRGTVHYFLPQSLQENMMLVCVKE